MAIPAQRMKPLDLETNLGIVDPLKIKSSDILNLASNQVQSVTSELQDFIKSMKQQLPDPSQLLGAAGGLTSMLDKGIRATRDAFTAMADITGFSPRDIESAIADMLPGDKGMQNVFKNVAAQCRNKGLGTGSGFKPWNDNIGCGSPGAGKCSSSEMRGVLDKLTGGAASSISRSLNSMLKSILALGNMGYDAGLCKIFGELVKGMPSGVIQRGAASLLAITGSAGKTNAVMDIASSMGKSVPSLEIPGLVGMAMGNFKTPGNYTPNQMKDLAEGYMTSMDAIQPNWDKGVDGVLSMANVGDKRSDDLIGVLDTVCSRDSFSLNDLGKAKIGEFDAFAGAYKSTTKVASVLGGFF